MARVRRRWRIFCKIRWFGSSCCQTERMQLPRDDEPEFSTPHEDDLPKHPLEPYVTPSGLREIPLPRSLTLEEAYKTTVFFVEQYLSLEKSPSLDFVLFYEYLLSDPAAASDFTDAVRRTTSREQTR
jgi:hypothetical protein